MTGLPLMIFAAGFGRRMAPLTDDRPKPLVEIGGRTLIDRALEMAHAAGVGRIVVNTHYRAGQMQAHLADRDVAISHESDILDTGGGLRHALPLLGPGPVMTLNPDVVWSGGNPLSALQKAWRPGMGALMALVAPERAVGRQGGGDVSLDRTGRVRFGGDLIYGGAQIIAPDTLPDRPGAYSLVEPWRALAERERLHGILHPGGWADVGRPDCIPLAEDMVADVRAE